jgi:hypothetical protein
VNGCWIFYEYIESLENCGKEYYTIDRIDNNLGYIPCNLRWATPNQQQLNRRNSINQNKKLLITEKN